MILPNGKYSLKFRGFDASRTNILNALTGIGYFKLKDRQIMGGRHSATLIWINNSKYPVNPIENAEFLLEGKCYHHEEDSEFCRASITYIHATDSKFPKMMGSFSVIHAGGSKYWFISTGGKFETPIPGVVPNEKILGELVRTDDL